MVTLAEALQHLRMNVPISGIDVTDADIAAEVQTMIDAAVDHLSSIGVDMTADPLPPALHRAVLLLVGHFERNPEATRAEQVRFTTPNPSFMPPRLCYTPIARWY